MLEITVKTLDGKNHKFSVPDDITVRQFKEAICNSIEIEADVQRLIFQGRVLADEKKINDYDVNGKTIHVVQRPPPSTKPQTSAEGASASRDHHHHDNRSRAQQHETNSFVLGSFSLPADAADPNHVQNMVQQMLSGMGDLGRAHVTTQNTANGSVDVHINVTPNMQQSDAQNRLTHVSRMLTSAQQTLDKLENLGTDDRDVPMETSADGPTSPQASGSIPRSGTGQSVPAGEGASNQDAAGQPNSLSQDPTVSNLSGLLEEILRFNETFAPHLSRFQQLMSTDPDLSGNAAECQQKQQLCDLTSETLHYMSHVYHGLSDLTVDMSQAPPRHIRATPSVLPQATAVIQQTIPVQAQISVAHVPVGMAPPAQGGTPAAGARVPAGAVPSSSGGAPAGGSRVPAGTVPSASGGVPAGGTRVPVGTPPPASAGTSATGAHVPVGTASSASAGTSAGGAHVPAGTAPSASGGTPAAGTPSSGASASGTSVGGSSTSGTSGSGASAEGATHAHAESKGATPNTGASNTSTTNQPSMSSRAGDQTSTASRNTSSTNSGSFTGRMPSPWESALPHIRLGMQGAAMPLQRPPTALPPGFHMFVEMSEDGATAGLVSQGAVPLHPDSFRTPTNQAGGTGAEAHLPEGGLPFPPGDFLQNIIQMAAGAALRGQAGQQVFVLSQGNMQPITVGASAVNRQSGGAPSTAPMNGSISSAGASTFTTNSAPAPSSTGTGGSQGQGANPSRPGTFAGPRMSGIFAPPVGMGGLHLGGPHAGAPLPSIFVDPFGLMPMLDPFLPCNSRHFMPSRLHQHTTANEAPQTSQPQLLAQHLVSNLVSSMMVPPGQGTASSAGQPGRGTVPVPPMARVFVMPNMMAAAGGAAHVGAQAQTGGRTAPAGPATATTTGPTDEVISRLIQGISTQLTQAAFGQQANMSIADFLGSLGNEFNISQGEGLLTDLFNCITQHLVFSDLMMIFFGQVTPIERLRVPLQTFVSTNVLNGQEPTDVAVEQAVTRLMANMEHDIEETAAAASSHNHIDYRASLTRFIRTHMMATIQLIINATDNGGFSQSLYDRSRLVIHEFIALSRFCLRGGVGALDALVQNRLQVIAAEVNPGMQMQMVQMARQQLHQILPMVTLRDEDIQQYVVPRDASSAAPVVGTSEASPQSTDSYETASGGIDVADEAPKEQLSSELSSVNTSASLARDRQSSNGFVGDADGNLPRISSDLLARLPPPPNQDDGNQVQVVIGSEEWHSEVPSVWVPVITRDVARQRRQAPQPSLSDAYLTGMPSKRRKVMSHERQREEFADVHVAIPEAMRRAAQQVDARPVTSFAELSHDVAGSSQLQAAFQQEISEAIRRRITSDPDYNPRRFPNIEKFFDAKK